MKIKKSAPLIILFETDSKVYIIFLIGKCLTNNNILLYINLYNLLNFQKIHLILLRMSLNLHTIISFMLVNSTNICFKFNKQCIDMCDQ